MDVVVAGISILAVVVAWAGTAVRVISVVDVVVSGMLILAVIVAFSVGGFVELNQAEILTGRASRESRQIDGKRSNYIH